MERKKLLVLFSSICLLMILVVLPLMTACKAELAPTTTPTTPPTTPPKELKTWHGILNVAHWPEDIGAVLLLELLDEWEQVTDGRVTFEAHFASELFGPTAALEAMSMGNLQMTHGISYDLASWDPRWGLFDLPFVFDSRDHLKRFVQQSPEFDSLVKDLEKFDMMSFGPASYAQEITPFFIYSTFPITKLEDLAGKRIRTQESPVMLKTFQLLGAQAVAIAFEEASTALSTGMIDGLTTCPPESWLMALGVYDYCHYQLNNAMVCTPTIWLVAKDWWESIDEDLRLKMEAVTLDWAERFYTTHGKAIEDCYALTEQNFGSEGMKTLTEAEMARWRTTLSPVYDDFFKEVPEAKPIYDAIARYR